MKTLSTQIIYFLRQRPRRMNIANLLRFLVVLALLITAYSVLFHVIMEWEGRDYSWVTGFYWTLTPPNRLHGHRPAQQRRHADQPRSS